MRLLNASILLHRIEILCHDINVHIPHHISPRIPSYNLRAAHQSLRQNWGQVLFTSVFLNFILQTATKRNTKKRKNSLNGILKYFVEQNMKVWNFVPKDSGISSCLSPSLNTHGENREYNRNNSTNK